jgi:FtsP/CotA-like multicopper oxidase with cupredoxin domain
MPGRRFVLFALLLLLCAALASALAPTQRRSAPAEPQLQTSPPPAQAVVVSARLPGRTVRARVGDVVRLAVRAPVSDRVEIDALGVGAPVDPGIPAELDFVADQPGRFAVVLRDAAIRVGTLHILPAA